MAKKKQTPKAGALPPVLAALSKEADITEVDGGYLIEFKDWACKIHGNATEVSVAQALARRPRKAKAKS